jgi:hypothetical protein
MCTSGIRCVGNPHHGLLPLLLNTSVNKGRSTFSGPRLRDKCRLLLAKDPGELQQICEGERARLGARQGGLPVSLAQDGVRAAPDQPDQ